MKRAQSPLGDGDERPAKVRHRGSSLRRAQEEPTKTKQLPLSFPPNSDSRNPVNLGSRFLPYMSTELTIRVFNWIPPPSENCKPYHISQLASKISPSLLVSTDCGQALWARDATSSAYNDVNYSRILETKGCFMRQSSAGPIPYDIALCERLFERIKPCEGTLFDDMYIQDFDSTLQNRSKARHLQPLLIPSAENHFIRGETRLKDVIGGYDDPWVKTDPIYGPIPQPDHTRGLKGSAFSHLQKRKLGIKSDKKSLYTVREEMYFPYLTAEIKCEKQALELADRQNMHSMCIALRAVVSLAQEAGRLCTVHRRLLGFSISHDHEGFRIYGYYPEIEDGETSFFRWPVAQLTMRTKEDRWACYRFVENLDREFLPIHTDRLMYLLAMVYADNDDLADYLEESADSRSYGRKIRLYF